jgi:hypothetical protein
LRCIDDAVGAKVYQGADIIGGDDACRSIEPAQLSCIPADLRRTCGMYSDQF